MFHILALNFLRYDLARGNSKVHQVALAFVTVLIRLQADLGYEPRPQTSHAKN